MSNDTNSNSNSTSTNGTNIVDNRATNVMKLTSFSGYRISEVKKCMYNDILQQKLESACNWGSELICSGQIDEVWNIFVLFVSKHVLLANPKLPIYIEERYNTYKNLVNTEMEMSTTEEWGKLEIRNNFKVRELIAEVCAIILFSARKPGIEFIKINTEDEFNVFNITKKCFAPNTSFAKPIMRNEDSKELWIAINEFSYQINNMDNHVPDIMKSIYWIEWVIGFNIICKKNKTKCVCEPRIKYKVDSRYQVDIVWLLWDALLYYSEKRGGIYFKIIQGLSSMYCIEYSDTVAKKRKTILYHAVMILTEPFNMGVKIIDSNNLMYCDVAIQNIHEVYREKRVNEQGLMKYLYDPNIL